MDGYGCHRLSVSHDPGVIANYAFFGDDAFDVESWPLGERIDVLASLILHQGFTVNWETDVE